MAEFLTYQLKVAIALSIFYMFYRLLLSKETFHRVNRIVLLSTALLSFLLPFCVITLHDVVVIPAGAVAEAGTAAEVVAEGHSIWTIVLTILFFMGVAAVLANVLVSVIRIRRIINGGSREEIAGGINLIVTEGETAPFSWMKYIVISRENYHSGSQQILLQRMFRKK